MTAIRLRFINAIFGIVSFLLNKNNGIYEQLLLIFVVFLGIGAAFKYKN